MHGGAEYEHLWFDTSEVRIHAVAAGPGSGPLLILLHGFPEFWYSWHKQIRPLAQAGFRVVAPDQRGYNLSSKPTLLSAYAMPHLVADVMAIADQLEAQSFFLAGHDWGAAVAWITALRFPQRLRKLGIINVPHPKVMLRNLLTNPRQLLRSWYIFFLQFPWIPEAILAARNFSFGVTALEQSSVPGTFTAEDLSRYREAWAYPGALTAMVNWYRAFVWHRPSLGDPQVHVPTRILWGKRDKFLLPGMAQQSVAYCDSAELTYFPENTHWLHHEQPEAVNQMLIDFFQ
jgi:pimeloyl-ACP methyl ester carboxylesterase